MFATLAQDGMSAKLTITSIILVVLVLNWLAMVFAETILEWTGTGLQVFTIVLGMT